MKAAPKTQDRDVRADLARESLKRRQRQDLLVVIALLVAFAAIPTVVIVIAESVTTAFAIYRDRVERERYEFLNALTCECRCPPTSSLDKPEK